MLFSDIVRTKFDTAKYSEPYFSYLDQSARLEANKVRELLEIWFQGYPDDGKLEFKSRFCSPKNLSFLSAFFELYLYALLTKLGYRVKDHPLIKGTDKRPDFLAEREEEPSFYLEAVLASELSSRGRAEESRMNQVYDVINTLSSPEFFVAARIRGTPSTPPPARKIKSSLEQWLSSLSWQSVVDERANHCPTIEFSHEGWNLLFTAIPKSPEIKDKHRRTPMIGSTASAFWSVSEKAVRDAVFKKATRYERLDKPYVIAVNSLAVTTDPEDVVNALYGTLCYQLASDGIKNYYTETRKKNGFWYGPSGCQNTRVSAILMVENLSPWAIAHRKLCLYHNPWARHPIIGSITKLPRFIPTEGNLEFKEGLHSRDLFDLQQDWPEDD